jgi:hypothetical protein
MPTEPQPITRADAVRRAVEVCDDGSSEGLEDLLLRFEDADEPLAAVGDIGQRLDEALGPVDADEDEAPLTMARAVVTYLAFRRDEIDAPPVELLRLAARAEFDDHPPDPVAHWLSLQGVLDER